MKDLFRHGDFLAVRARDLLEDVETLHIVNSGVHCCRPVVRIGRRKRLREPSAGLESAGLESSA